jgi:hypothetical protein
MPQWTRAPHGSLTSSQSRQRLSPGAALEPVEEAILTVQPAEPEPGGEQVHRLIAVTGK